MGLEPITAANAALGVSGFMNAALGVRFLAGAFLVVGFFAGAFFVGGFLGNDRVTAFLITLTFDISVVV